MTDFIRYQSPASLRITSNMERSLEEVFSNKIFTEGKYTRKFEQRFKEEFDLSSDCVAVSSCTSGLILAMRAFGIRFPIISDYTFSATAHAAHFACQKFDVGDIDMQTFNMLPILPMKCDAIAVTHTFGNPCDCMALQELAEERNAHLIFDSAHAIGASLFNRSIAEFGDASVFSFSPTKHITAGEGGMIITKHKHIAERVRILKNYGTEKNYECSMPGLNARMSEFHAIIGLESLRSFRKRQAHRIRLVKEYELLLRDKVKFQQVIRNGESAWKDFTLIIEPKKIGRLRTMLLSKHNIETKSYFRPISSLSCYRGSFKAQSNAKKLSMRVIQPPLHDGLSIDDIEYISRQILKYI